MIEQATAERLAALSDEVADRLEAQDACGARARASELTSAAVAAINARKVPTAYLEDFLGAVNELEAQIPACDEAEPEEDDEPANGKPKDKGKGKKKGHKKREKGDD